jgi:hypothetical protein
MNLSMVRKLAICLGVFEDRADSDRELLTALRAFANGFFAASIRRQLVDVLGIAMRTHGAVRPANGF